MKAKEEFLNRLTRLYKGFEIEVTAVSVRGEKNSFTAHLVISKDARSYTDEMVFHSGQIFPDINAALEAGIKIGQQQIDAGFRPATVVSNK